MPYLKLPLPTPLDIWYMGLYSPLRTMGQGRLSIVRVSDRMANIYRIYGMSGLYIYLGGPTPTRAYSL